MDSTKVSAKKSKKGKVKRESTSGSLNSSLKGKLKENEDDNVQKKISPSEETEFPYKFTVLLDPLHPRSKSIKTGYATFLHPSILRAYHSPWYFYIKGELNDSLCVAYPLKTIRKPTIVLPKDTMGFMHQELVILCPYQGIINKAATVSVAFDDQVTVNEKVEKRVLDALITKKFFYRGMRLKCLSLDHCEFTVTDISCAESESDDENHGTLNKSKSKLEELTSKKSELSFSQLSSQFSALSLKQNESQISQYSDGLNSSYQFDPQLLPDEIIPTFFTVFHRTSITIQTQEEDNTEHTDLTPDFTRIGGLKQQLEDMKSVIDLFLDPENPLLHKVGVLFLSGPSGTGKSSILEALHKEFNFNIEEILWFNIYSKVLSEGANELRQTFKRARSRTPSIVLIDDFNCLVPMKASHDLIPSVLSQEIENCVGKQVVIVAASNDPNYDKEILKSWNIMVEDIKLQKPDTVQREDIIIKLLESEKHKLSLEDIRKFASSSQGFTGKDLKDVLKDAAAHCFLKMENDLVFNESEKETAITFLDIKNALNRKLPSISRSEVKIKKVKWEDIGGMADVKKKLKEIVKGPLKLPETYKRFDMKPSRGVLLYGPPGCSKTMIAKALATECDLSFISKNVSDIHNKYVGESEKAVSDLFIMARAKSPCIVFLDEIDALIPSRGSSTGSGVEERVVNVFLQELDGIEELNNVIIVAATNRPDRIDEAFLRYGRISHYVYIPLPDLEAREEILRIQMRKRTVSSDFDYKHLALETEGYSGAEIVNLCNEAAFQLLNEDLDCTGPVFTMRHFEKSLQSILPRTDKQLLEVFETFNAKFCLR